MGGTLFNPAAREPTQAEARLMLSLALRELVMASMNNHVYSFNGVIRRQHRQLAHGQYRHCLCPALV